MKIAWIWRTASKLLALAALLTLAAAPTIAAEGNWKLEFTTVSTGGKYSPRHVLAAWVTDGNTNFVKTICRYGTKRQKYLFAWNNARGTNSQVDGVTGATRTTHEVVTVSWNGRDAENKPLPDGPYLIFVEFADEHRPGPKLVLPMTMGPKAESKTLPDQPNFKNIKATFTP